MACISAFEYDRWLYVSPTQEHSFPPERLSGCFLRETTADGRTWSRCQSLCTQTTILTVMGLTNYLTYVPTDDFIASSPTVLIANVAPGEPHKLQRLGAKGQLFKIPPR